MDSGRRRVAVALAERRVDLILMAFFALNLLFITYIVDLEQLVIANPYHFIYPLWPPPPLVNLVHWYGRTFDPLLMARPVWWKATIWIDALFFGPFYAIALYAYATARDWIRIPTIIWASVMMTNVSIIMSEEIWGPDRAPHLLLVAGANLPWFALPILAIARMAGAEHPFTRPALSSAAFRARYGAWALVAGASEGLGREFARALGARGLNLVLVARRPQALEETAREIRTAHGVEVRTLSQDLSDPAAPALLDRHIGELEIGLLVYNAAHAPVGGYLERDVEEALRAVDVNVRGPVALTHLFGQRMARRGRGGIVLMASFAGLQGSPRIAAYAASKAFNLILAESLWGELRHRGVDVLGCCAGAIRTPAFERAALRPVPGSTDARTVAEGALDALGRGPRYVPGGLNRVAVFLTTRLLSRRRAVLFMEGQASAVD